MGFFKSKKGSIISNKGERKRGISQWKVRDRSLSQSRDITLTQIPVKMFPIFSHVTLTSL